ncbi:hypothetical protein [Nocardiopsis tropica]|uniref:Thymidylate kinase n=1 Tax=Nocardiopsis tropica TaxID=109330 RepID=A0ABU7KT21_9ACTN|nr:hypothetical protein [Nocardiopsis umidischolae]MEE2052446.1 hypothetical protein [Nocardiopsis umidischolae]
METDDLGDQLFELFSSSGDPFMRHGDVLTDTFLAAAIRANIVANQIKSATSDHDIVIEDRGAHTMLSYSLASLIRYHDTEPAEGIAWLRSILTLAGPTSDIALWLRPPVRVVLDRWAHREGHQPPPERCAFLASVDTAYQELASTDDTLHPLNVGEQRAEDVHEQILATLRPLLSDDR